MRRVLVLSDRPATIEAVEWALRFDGHAVRAEADAESALNVIQQWRPSLLMLDLGMRTVSLKPGELIAAPEASGVAVVGIAEEHTLELVGTLPTIDDFVVSPWEEAEFRMRVERLLVGGDGERESSVLRCGGLEIDPERYKVTVEEQVVDLTYKEYELLRFLATNRGRPFTREALLNQVWGYDYYGGSRTVDVHVRRIRAKIEEHEPFIETVRNVGYRFTERR